MVGKASVGVKGVVGVRIRSPGRNWALGTRKVAGWATICAGLLACFSLHAAFADDCPGHPDAIGTSRTLVVDPRQHPHVGTMQYPETLPLKDHEVVLTFDDGPLPRNSNKILQILADNCVKATFFTIGEQARAFPDGVRKLAAAGHTIGTHSQDHPLTFDKMPMDRVKQEVDEGIASVSAALPDPTLVAPFFRIPGLLRGANIENYLASKGIQIWSADFLADDWRRISPERVYELAMKRMEVDHKGILLLHDIQARTVEALPKILHEMKVRGYHIVHVVPATPELPATPTEPQDWRMHPAPEAAAVAEATKLPTFAFAEAEGLVRATTAPADFSTPDGKLLLSAAPFDRVKRPIHQGVPATASSWPRPTMPATSAAATLAAPSESLFEMPEKAHASLRPLASIANEPMQPGAPQTETEAKPPASSAIPAARRAYAAKMRLAHHVHYIRHSVGHLAHGGNRAVKHQAHSEIGARQPVLVASLNKR